MLARVMTFHGRTESLGELVGSLREQLRQAYEPIPGFRGMLVLDKRNASHVIAISLWEDERSLEASEAHARAFAEQISRGIGSSVSRATYDVVGSLRVGLESS